MHSDTWTRLTVVAMLAAGLCIALPSCDSHAGHDHGDHDHDGAQHDTDEHAGHDHDGADHDGAEHVGHDHDGFLRHGGTLHEVGDHAALLEVVLDHDAKSVTVYVMDAEGAALAPDGTPVLNLVSGGAPAQVPGTLTDGAWHFAHEALGGDPEKAEIRLTVGGKSHGVALTHEH